MVVMLVAALVSVTPSQSHHVTESGTARFDERLVFCGSVS